MSLSLQRLLQDGLAARQLTLDRVDRDPADGRELSISETVDVVESEQDARLARHRVQRGRQIEPLHRCTAAPARQLFGKSAAAPAQFRSEERRVGKEGRSGWTPGRE